MRRTERALVWLATLVALLLPAGSSRAQLDEDSRRAKVLFEKAEIHFNLGEFKEALGLYKEAYKAKPLPAFLFNLGQCRRNMGQCDKALFFFKQYLVHSPNAGNRADVEKLIRICEAAVRNAQRVEDDRTGNRSTAPDSPSTTDAPDEATEPKQRTKADDAAEQVSKTASRRKLRPFWFWSGVGLSGALLITGVVTGVSALGKSDDYKAATTPIDRRRELRDSGETLRTVSTVTMIAGGLTAVTAAVLLFVTDWGGSTEKAAVSAAPLPGGATLVLEGRF